MGNNSTDVRGCVSALGLIDKDDIGLTFSNYRFTHYYHNEGFGDNRGYSPNSGDNQQRMMCVHVVEIPRSARKHLSLEPAVEQHSKRYECEIDLVDQVGANLWN